MTKIPSKKQIREAQAEVVQADDANNEAKQTTLPTIPETNPKAVQKHKTKDNARYMQWLLEKYDGKTPLGDVIMPMLFGERKEDGTYMTLDERVQWMVDNWLMTHIEAAQYISTIAIKGMPYFHSRQPVQYDINKKSVIVHVGDSVIPDKYKEQPQQPTEEEVIEVATETIANTDDGGDDG